jgi:hypothetical protein
MTEQPGRRPDIYLPLCRGKLLTSCSIPASQTYKNISRVLEGRYGDHKLGASYQSQLKAKTQLSSKSLEEFAASIDQLSH